MSLYRKKPMVIDAFQFKKVSTETTPRWFRDAIKIGAVWYQGGENPYYTIKTLEGEMRADLGDYIIKGVKGEIYPCKPDIFELSYEQVEE